jgi:putative transposase
MKVQRTVRLKLRPTPEQVPILRATLAQYTACFNAVAVHGWSRGIRNGVQLHRDTYYPLRATQPTLPSQLVCAARVRATEAVKAALDRQKKGRPVRCPRSRSAPIRYDARSYRVTRERDAVTLATVAGRQHVPFRSRERHHRQLAVATAFDSADLLERRSGFWLYLTVTLPDVPFEDAGAVVGIDLGLDRPAVASNNTFHGPRRWRAIERRTFRLRRQLQAKGTPSARRRLRRLGSKVARFRRDCDHVLSKRLVQSVEPGTTLVVENLAHIRSRTKQRGREQRRRFHAWSFAQLRRFLTYKAEAAGCRVVGVDPRHTSQTCSRCGFQDRRNRVSQAVFRCRSCGFELHADLNGSRNVAAKYRAQSGRAVLGGPSVNRPIVGEPEGFAQQGSTGKLPAWDPGRQALARCLLGAL